MQIVWPEVGSRVPLPRQRCDYEVLPAVIIMSALNFQIAFILCKLHEDVSILPSSADTANPCAQQKLVQLTPSAQSLPRVYLILAPEP